MSPIASEFKPVPPLITESGLPSVSELSCALDANRFVDDAVVENRFVVVAFRATRFSR